MPLYFSAITIRTRQLASALLTELKFFEWTKQMTDNTAALINQTNVHLLWPSMQRQLNAKNEMEDVLLRNCKWTTKNILKISTIWCRSNAAATEATAATAETVYSTDVTQCCGFRGLFQRLQRATPTPRFYADAGRGRQRVNIHLFLSSCSHTWAVS